jgi:hypothetical protein
METHKSWSDDSTDIWSYDQIKRFRILGLYPRLKQELTWRTARTGGEIIYVLKWYNSQMKTFNFNPLPLFHSSFNTTNFKILVSFFEFCFQLYFCLLVFSWLHRKLPKSSSKFLTFKQTTPAQPTHTGTCSGTTMISQWHEIEEEQWKLPENNSLHCSPQFPAMACVHLGKFGKRLYSVLKRRERHWWNTLWNKPCTLFLVTRL